MSTTAASNIIFSRTRLLLLKELVMASNQPVHLRELARRSRLDPSGVGRELKRLEEAGIVIARMSGHQKSYTLNINCPIYDELVMIVLKTIGLGDMLRAALGPLQARIDRAYIYGSFASGKHKLESDIDLLVVGDVSLAEVVKAVSATGRKLSRVINPTVYKPKDYRKKLKDGTSFISRIEAGPKIYLIGDNRGT